MVCWRHRGGTADRSGPRPLSPRHAAVRRGRPRRSQRRPDRSGRTQRKRQELAARGSRGTPGAQRRAGDPGTRGTCLARCSECRFARTEPVRAVAAGPDAPSRPRASATPGGVPPRDRRRPARVLRQPRRGVRAGWRLPGGGHHQIPAISLWFFGDLARPLRRHAVERGATTAKPGARPGHKPGAAVSRRADQSPRPARQSYAGTVSQRL